MPQSVGHRDNASIGRHNSSCLHAMRKFQNWRDRPCDGSSRWQRRPMEAVCMDSRISTCAREFEPRRCSAIIAATWTPHARRANAPSAESPIPACFFILTKRGVRKLNGCWVESRLRRSTVHARSGTFERVGLFGVAGRNCHATHAQGSPSFRRHAQSTVEYRFLRDVV